MTTSAQLREKPVLHRAVSRGLVRFAWAVVGWNVLIILWGAVVRATGSGAGCGNHWPLCNGVVVPVDPRVDTMIEFAHRVTTGLALPLILWLLVWIFRGTARGALARVTASISVALTLNEALLGALLVKLGYVAGNQSVGRAVLLSLHLTNTLLLVAALTMTASALGRGLRRGEMHINRRPLPIVLAALLTTIFVGVTGSLAALGDTLFPSRSLASAWHDDFATNAYYLLRIRWIHPACSILAAVFISWMIWRAWRGQERPYAQMVLALLAVQFLIGIADVLLLAPVPLQILHLLMANAFWIALLLLASRVAIQTTDAP